MNRFIALLIMTASLAVTSTSQAETRIGIHFIVHDNPADPIRSHSETESKLKDYIKELNIYYQDSAINLQAEPVHVTFSRIDSVEAVEILDDMVHERNGFTRLLEQADFRGADYTVAVTNRLTIKQKPGCGRALAVNQTRQTLASTRQSFMVMNGVCGSHTLAHELGHLMGLNHGSVVANCQPRMGHTSAITSYANGFGIGNCDARPQPGEFGTIMVGGWMGRISGNDKASLPLFSNPRLQDKRCGIKQICGDPNHGDAARALNENAHLYAAHEEPDVATLSFASPALQACITRQTRHAKEIADFTELACPNAHIDNLTGLEQLTALQRIDLSDNPLTGISPLLSLNPERVQSIDLTKNTHISCEALHPLTKRFPNALVPPTRCQPDASPAPPTP